MNIFFLDAQGTVYRYGRVVEGFPPIRQVKTSMFVDYEGQVWSGGVTQPILMEGLPRGVKSIDHYDKKMIMLCEDGSVWTAKKSKINALTELKRLDLDVHVVAVAINRYAAIILDDRDHLYHIKSDGSRSNIIGVASFEACDESMIILDVNGNVYTYLCQLEKLIHIEVLKNIQAVSCEGFTFTALTTDGRVYSWGLNSEGKLGRKSPPKDDHPRVIPGLPPIREVSVCRRLVLFVSLDNELWTTTRNNSVKLYTSSILDQIYLRRIPDKPRIKSAQSI